MGKDRTLIGGKTRRHDPLEAQIQSDRMVTARDQQAGRGAERRERARGQADVESGQQASAVLNDRTSRKILQQARLQQEEILAEEEREHERQFSKRPDPAQKAWGAAGRGRRDASDDDSDLELEEAAYRRRGVGNGDDEDDEDDEEIIAGNYASLGGSSVAALQALTAEDQRALEMFMPRSEPAARETLGDIIMAKMRERKEEMDQAAAATPDGLEMLNLDPKVIRVYTEIGNILSRYKSGKVPKAFKIVPSLSNWEEILYITRPDEWSPNAVYQATRLFASNCNAKMAQRFYSLVLLPRLRDEFRNGKKLNFHIYMSLKKALYKPAAFFKGILLPLCESGTCTLREAVVVGSVVTKVSIPVLHSAAALLKLAQMEYSGANSLFMRVLIDKKYALPFRVVDELVLHFTRFMYETRSLPVLWHQALLAFLQRYKEDITEEQKDLLRELVKKQSHPLITPDILREINESKSRTNDEVSIRRETTSNDLDEMMDSE